MNQIQQDTFNKMKAKIKEIIDLFKKNFSSEFVDRSTESEKNIPRSIIYKEKEIFFLHEILDELVVSFQFLLL